MSMESLRRNYPAISYLEKEARRRTPHFAWEYLDSGTGMESALRRNRAALDAVLLEPRFMHGYRVPDTSVTLLGQEWAAPIGVAPIGLAGMMWPQAETILARAATARKLPFCLSMVGCETPETVGPLTEGRGWFQLYPVKDRPVEKDILERAEHAGFAVLVVTVDLPINSTRERQRKAGVGGAGERDWSQIVQALARPSWLAATLRRGTPSLRTIAKYTSDSSVGGIVEYVTSQQMGAADMDHLKQVRDDWKGPLIIKGILDGESVEQCRELGADAVVISNHGGRQFDAAVASIDALAKLAPKSPPDVELLLDSGIRTGLDVARGIAAGAKLAMAGRAFMFGVCAAGEDGAGLVADLLMEDLANNMMQLGVENLDGLAQTLLHRS